MPTTYESSLRTSIIADASGVFIDTWGEAIVRRIEGSLSSTETINAVVEFDKEDEGQPFEYEQPQGEQIIRRGLLEVVATQDIERTDKFVIDGEVWSARRIQSRDDGLKTVTIVLTEGQTSRTSRARAS